MSIMHEPSTDMSRDPTATIAIVEDEPVLRTELAFQLERQGFAVATFENAEQFYRHLAVQPVQIALLDIGLTGEDGLSICRHLRSHDPRFGIVFMTARAMRDDRLAGLQAGGDAYLVKPVDLDELVLILNRLIERIMPPPQARVETRNDWRLEPDRGLLLSPAGQRLHLSAGEIQVLGVLLREGDRACSHGTLAVAMGLMPQEYNRHRVEVILSRLRARVLRETGQALPIVAVRGYGYRFGC
jgi:DNA-binding response OmpR family regulator